MPNFPIGLCPYTFVAIRNVVIAVWRVESILILYADYRQVARLDPTVSITKTPEQHQSSFD